MTLRFSSEGENPPFVAGQFITVYFPELCVPEGKAYSISSVPGDTELSITVKALGQFSRRLCAMRAGDSFLGSDPYGFFFSEEKETPLVMLAVGIGITPFRSIIKDATEQSSEQKLILIYSNRAPEDAAFVDDLEEWQAHNTNFNFVTRWTKEDGHIDEQFLKKHIKNLAAPMYYVAGPAGMVAGTTQLLIEIGVKEDNIRFEEFAGY